MGYYIDERYLYDTERCEQQLDLGQRFTKTMYTNPYFVQRWHTPEHPLHVFPQFQYPEFFFWADADKGKLRLLYPRLELYMWQEWSQSQQEVVCKALNNLWTEEQLHDIYNYLCQQPFSDYYYALQSFKWAAHLWLFPLFEQYNYIQLIDGKLFGWLPVSRSRDAEYHWCLLTEKTLGRELYRLKGEGDISNRKKDILKEGLRLLA